MEMIKLEEILNEERKLQRLIEDRSSEIIISRVKKGMFIFLHFSDRFWSNMTKKEL